MPCLTVYLLISSVYERISNTVHCSVCSIYFPESSTLEYCAQAFFLGQKKKIQSKSDLLQIRICHGAEVSFD